MSVELLSRSDDFGSAWAANEAILEGCKKGYVINLDEIFKAFKADFFLCLLTKEL